MSTSIFRLPSHVSPLRYDIRLNAAVGREDFSGHETISLEIRNEINTIDLHSRGLVVTDVHLSWDGQALPAIVVNDPDNERIVLQFSQAVPPGKASLSLAFQGKINQQLRGLYLSQDQPDQVLCTQCATIDARAIFPCFDEPTFKAQFALEVTTPDAMVLSNAPLLSVTDHQDSRTWKFAPTKTMSSYLFALIIGDMTGTEEKIVNGIPLRVWAMRGKERMGRFALEYTARLLPWYENYFGIPYHFDKFDQAAVPGFAAGAMENSGLVIFRQHFLLMEPESSSWFQEKNIALVVSHEFAHMWFGDLVTMQWWDDIWLNEAFAQWMAFRVIAELSPEYHIWDHFMAPLNYVFGVDALDTTHPIYTPVQTPAQADELFDAITYTKGCAVLRMLESFLGSESFRDGLRSYMQEFAERNACGPDLWRHLQAASHQPVTDIMESWILQAGHPCITADFEIFEDKPCLQLSQKRFFINPKAGDGNHQLWQIPIVIRYADDGGPHILRHVLTEAAGTLTLPTQGELHWCTLNADQIGFYRQNPAAPLLNKLLLHLDQLTPSEQMGLLGDQWALTRRGDQSITQFLDVLAAMASQTDDYNLLSQIVEHLHTLGEMVEDLQSDQVMEQFRRWVGDLFRDRLKVLGFEPRPAEPAEVAEQRASMIDALGTLAYDPDVISQAGILAEREANDPQSVDSNLAGPAIAIHAQFGDETVFQKYVDIYQQRKANGAPPQTVNRYLNSFPSFRSPELVAQTLSLLEEGIAPLEAWGPSLYTMLDLRHSRVAAWEFIKKNWLKIREVGLWAGDLIKSSGKIPYSMRDDYISFCEANVKGLADMGYAQGLENMDLLAEFQSRTKSDLASWLASAERE